MGFLKGLFAPETKDVTRASEATARATSSSLASSYGSWGLGPVGNWDIDKAVTQGLERVVWVQRAVDVIATNQANLTMRPRKGKGNIRVDGEWVDDPRIYNLVNRVANAYESSWMFRYRLSTVLLLARRGAFVEIVKGRDGRPAQLHILPTGSTYPIPDVEKFVAGYRVVRSDGHIDELPPEKVIWLRLKPHPTDPYSQLTPLMSAGINVETDWLANMFNRNFLANDGRPGMLVTINGQMNPIDMAEIKARFSGGPMGAGRTTVIEADGVDVADMSANPRDVQWSELLASSKERILMAFGVPESVMGNASGRTFDNADAERENFWMDTMVPHCDNIAYSFDIITGDTNDDTVMAYDYSTVDVLQRAARMRREEKRQEFAAGVATLDDYLSAAGQEPINVVGSRVYFHPNGVVIATNPEDQQIADKFHPIAPAPPGEGGLPGDIGTQMGAQISQTIIGRAQQIAGTSPSAPVAQITSMPDTSRRSGFGLSRRSERREAAGRGFKSADQEGDLDPIIDAEVEEEKGHPYQNLRDRMEGMIEGIVLGWDDRQAQIASERLFHAKARKGTRHWDGEDANKVELKAIDPSYIVDVQKWADELRSTLRRSIYTAMQREAKTAARDMVATGVVAQLLLDRGMASTGDPILDVFGSRRAADNALGAIYEQVDAIIDRAAQTQSRRIMDVIASRDAEGRNLKEIEAQVRKMTGARSQWRKALSVNVVTAAVEGARNAVYEKGGRYMLKKWNAEKDERTRPTHVAADGQTVAADGSFTVGAASLRVPCDPLGPPQEVVNCRCWATWLPSPYLDELMN